MQTRRKTMTISFETAHTVAVDYDEMCGALAAKNMRPLWRIGREILSKEPTPATQAWMWKWQTILPLAKRAGEVVPLERGGDRRVLSLVNPGLADLPFTTKTLWGGIQYLQGRENAPAHRHSPGAIRFVLSGLGATTTVDGDACTMAPGDLVLTPGWTWHDHNSERDEPVVWFDGLDLPLVAHLETVFFENHPLDRQPVVAHNGSTGEFLAPGLRPLDQNYPAAHSPLYRYAWEATDRALQALIDSGRGPHVALTFTDPVTGGPVLPALGCEMHRLLPTGRQPAIRRTGSAVYVVYRGTGRTVINGEAFDWEAGDIFVTPSWAAVDHQAHEPSDLFAITDRPVLEKLHLYREEAAGHQEVASTFEPVRHETTTPAQAGA
jgi:gentisate 1,2-dioxygenase